MVFTAKLSMPHTSALSVPTSCALNRTRMLLVSDTKSAMLWVRVVQVPLVFTEPSCTQEVPPLFEISATSGSSVVVLGETR